MSANFIPLLVEERLLAEKVAQVKSGLSPDSVSIDRWNEALSDTLFSRPHERLPFATWPGKRPWGWTSGTRWARDAEHISFQLLTSTQSWNPDNWPIELSISADALFQFLRVFHCYDRCAVPFNEFGLTNCTIISPSSARRLHALFGKIDFAGLRPVYDAKCQRRCDGEEYGHIQSFDELVDYVSGFDGLLIQSMEQDKMLYVCVNC